MTVMVQVLSAIYWWWVKTCWNLWRCWRYLCLRDILLCPLQGCGCFLYPVTGWNVSLASLLNFKLPNWTPACCCHVLSFLSCHQKNPGPSKGWTLNWANWCAGKVLPVGYIQQNHFGIVCTLSYVTRYNFSSSFSLTSIRMCWLAQTVLEKRPLNWCPVSLMYKLLSTNMFQSVIGGCRDLARFDQKCHIRTSYYMYRGNRVLLGVSELQ